MIFENNLEYNIRIAGKFYFLDYFMILLECCFYNSEERAIFSHFKILKNSEQLGESKYRKLTIEENLTHKQERRYYYTFKEIVNESEKYQLVKKVGNEILITDLGEKLLDTWRINRRDSYDSILTIMENKSNAFNYLLKVCQNSNQLGSGLLIFPIYSPRKLGFDKKKMTLMKNWDLFFVSLTNRLELDLKKQIGKSRSLIKANLDLKEKLYSEKLLTKNSSDLFDFKNYNNIIGRIRKFWLNYFLKEIYEYPYSFDLFNIWVERAKQIGLMHSTEFYPNFDGRIIYPTSIVISKASNEDFKKLHTYLDGLSLFSHRPNWKRKHSKKGTSLVEEMFIKTLANTYFDIKMKRKLKFIQVSDLREKVCFKMKIPSFVFNDFLEKAYNRSLENKLSIQISLEADRLPEETNAMYIKREPVVVNKQRKNIIAINIKK